MQAARLVHLTIALDRAAMGAQPDTQPEPRPRLGDFRRHLRQTCPGGVSRQGVLAGIHPGAHGVEIGHARRQALGLVLGRHGLGLEVHAAEVIGRARRLGRSHDPALFVDPDRLRHVHEIVEVFEAMVGVDQLPVLRLRLLDPRPRMVRAAAFLGHGHHQEIPVLQFGVELLPHGQVKPAASPTGPGGEEDLLAAELRERPRRAVNVRQGEVRRL